MAKIVPNPFISDSNNPVDMKQYFHVECLFETFTRARLSTKVIESSDDIEGWKVINDDDKAKILEQINNLDEFRVEKFGEKARFSKKEIEKNTGDELSNVSKNSSQLAVSPEFPSKESVKNNELYRQEKLSRKKENDSQKNNFRSNEKSNKSKFDSFKVFCKLCDVIARVSKCSDKSTAIHMFITRDGYDGDLLLLVKLLIPSIDQRIYNLKKKQLIKLFSKIFDSDSEQFKESFDQSGDISVAVENALAQKCDTSRKSCLSNQEVDNWLNDLSKIMEENERESHIKFISNLATPFEMRYIIRLILKDLRIKADAKLVLDSIKSGAYEEFKSTGDLNSILCIESKPKSDLDQSPDDNISSAKSSLNDSEMKDDEKSTEVLVSTIKKKERNTNKATEKNRINITEEIAKSSSEKKVRKKRKLKDEAREQTKKSKAECKYGAECYRKNPEHLKKYHHE